MSAAVTTHEAKPAQVPPRRSVPARVRPMTAWFFLVLVCYQAFHQLEHTIETVQLQLLGHDESDTLLNGVDFEWLHFGANALLLYGLVAVVVGAGSAARARWRAERRWGWWAMVAALVVQSYHVFDHTVRLVEYVSSGGDKDPAGTLTRVVNPVWFHFGINLTVLVGMIAAFAGLRVHRSLRAPRRPAAVPPPAT